jgi:hypothetical protein
MALLGFWRSMTAGRSDSRIVRGPSDFLLNEI